LKHRGTEKHREQREGQVKKINHLCVFPNLLLCVYPFKCYLRALFFPAGIAALTITIQQKSKLYLMKIY